ncbi:MULTISPECIES: hypothetical protein [Ralstonia]|uniref:DUF3325 domain-containing protein n=1 Tax=Ralstonia mannitolilytica TaxID=105219 RepID=A0AAJ5D7E8_9RALS|nr:MULTISPECIES: hypothetical protein [Ralstonia]MBU9580102.1 hypothetical protein [Ralstonia mannitolilytica]PLT18105.1 hypothetical protein CXP34_16180 [Ralstonia mannitolilytica]QIF09829.1 hypothetical protein G5A69_20160 [Ralstonia mannitolilytica]CAG2132867.1 hypothetical protein LMG6866_01029 [Ralstonia mannitolilytica]CAJ0727377.1 hypothetical protein R77592_01304 [Ralstonia mannitolilytica]
MTVTNNLPLWSCATFLFLGMGWLFYRATADTLRQIRTRAVTWRQSTPFAVSMAVAGAACLSFLAWAVTGGQTGAGVRALLLAAAALLLASLVCPLREP